MQVAGEPRLSVGGRLNSIWLELTQKCNLTCNHCYADSHPGRDLHGHMAAEDWVAIIDAAAAMGCSCIQFIGGEPLLHPSIEMLVRRAKHLQLQVEILTNGTVLPRRTLDWMAALQVSVSTSIYSACAKDHDAVTGRQGSWKRTVANIDRLIEQGVTVRAGIIYREWEKDGVEATSAFLRAKGVAVGTDRVRGIGRGGGCDTADGYMAALCGACGNKRICVTSTGDVYPCVMARKTLLGSVKRRSLAEIVAGNRLTQFRESLGRAKPLEAACTPDCWPHGGCAPHDLCNPHKVQGNQTAPRLSQSMKLVEAVEDGLRPRGAV